MHHQLIDHLSYLGGPIHRRDPRAKIVALLGLIFVTVLTPIQNLWHFPAYACVLATVIAISRVPVRYVLRHALIILPFVLVVAVFLPFLGEGDAVWSVRVGSLVLAVTREGLWILANVLVKASISVLATITLVSTTRFADLLKGFERFRGASDHSGDPGFPLPLYLHPHRRGGPAQTRPRCSLGGF